jgi:hypothetical protein
MVTLVIAEVLVKSRPQTRRVPAVLTRPREGIRDPPSAPKVNKRTSAAELKINGHGLENWIEKASISCAAVLSTLSWVRALLSI